jgi:hypothetical protein
MKRLLPLLLILPLAGFRPAHLRRRPTKAARCA